MKNQIKIILFSGFFLSLDQITKFLAKTYLEKPFYLIQNFFSFQIAKNEGIAWSIKINKTFIIVLSIILVVAGFYIAKKHFDLENKKSIILLSLIFGGALGNIIDRIYYGYVIDFISISIYPVFNIADIEITLGCVLIIFLSSKWRLLKNI